MMAVTLEVYVIVSVSFPGVVLAVTLPQYAEMLQTACLCDGGCYFSWVCDNACHIAYLSDNSYHIASLCDNDCHITWMYGKGCYDTLWLRNDVKLTA